MPIVPCRVCLNGTPFFNEIYNPFKGAKDIYLCEKHLMELNETIELKLESMIFEERLGVKG